MAIRTMTLEEAMKRPVSKEEYERMLRATEREPDLTDPDAPEVSDNMVPFASRPGRRNPAMKKVLIPIRLDSDVAKALKATGRNWTTRANNLLRQSLHQQGLI